MWKSTSYFSLPINATEILEAARFSKYSRKGLRVSDFPDKHVIFKNLFPENLFIISSCFVEKFVDLLSLCVCGFCFVLLSRLQQIFTECQLSMTRKQQVVHSLKTGLQIFLLYISLYFFRFSFSFYQGRELLLFIVIPVIDRVWRGSGFKKKKKKILILIHKKNVILPFDLKQINGYF